MTHYDDIHLTRELDAAWIIALWFYIHGGDPAPEIRPDKGSLFAATGLAEHLAERYTPGAEPLTLEQLRARLKPLGLEVEHRAPQEAKATALATDENPLGTIYHPRPYCFVFEGEVYCITLPQTHHPLPE